jgi:alpha-1,6-mannosyltransferase
VVLTFRSPLDQVGEKLTVRIVQVANFVGPKSGGASRVMQSLRAVYRARGHEVVEVVPRSGDHTFDRRSGRVTIARNLRLPTSGGYRVIWGRRELERQLELLRPDVVEISDLSTLTWIAQWCSERSIDCTVIAHERIDHAVDRIPIIGGSSTWLSQRWITTVEKHATRIVCPSRFAAEQFSDFGKVIVRPWGVDHEVFHPKGVSAEWREEPRALVVSRLSTEKCVGDSIDFALGLVEARGGSVRVIGDGPSRRRLRDAYRDRPVSFDGHVSDRWAVATAMRSADLLVNLGPVETFGLVTLEAMACGAPVVVRDRGGSRELVDSTVGWCLSDEDLENRAFAEQVFGRRRSSMSHSAAERASHHTWDAVADVMIGSRDRVHVR